MNLPKILLASKSPRRKELLEKAGFSVEIVHADVDEGYPPDIEEAKIAEYIAANKAAPFYDMPLNDALLITADSIVVLDGIVYGKPVDRDDAIRTIQKLSNNIHKVYTGVCIYNGHKTVSFTAISEIKFDHISMEETIFYIDEYKPYDKAGSYGIQDWIGLCKVEWIKGTFSNIMGLPIAQVYTVIMKEFV